MLESLQSTGLIVSGNGYRLASIDVVDLSKMPAFTAQLAEGTTKHWPKGSRPCVTLELQNLGANKLTVPVSAILTRDNGEACDNIDQITVVESGAAGEVTLELGSLEPGMYRLAVIAGGRLVDSFNIACDPEGIKSATDAQADFNEFWSNAIQQLATIDPQYKLTELPDKAAASANSTLWKCSPFPTD